jgi:hypothetical protein
MRQFSIIKWQFCANNINDQFSDGRRNYAKVAETATPLKYKEDIQIPLNS